MWLDVGEAPTVVGLLGRHGLQSYGRCSLSWVTCVREGGERMNVCEWVSVSDVSYCFGVGRGGVTHR